ncbi:MAG: ribonuclease HI family protein [Thermoplasmata archaeon]
MPDDPLDDAQIPRGIAEGGERAEVALVHFDGACQTVDGVRVATYGYTVVSASGHREGRGLAVPPGAPHATNNVAEYCAAIRALEELRAEGYAGKVLVRGDSQLVLRQMDGSYAIRSEHLKAYHERLRQLVSGFSEVRFEWVPRSQNAIADALSKQALAEEREALRSSGSYR